jgi:hypothetical protein
VQTDAWIRKTWGILQAQKYFSSCLHILPNARRNQIRSFMAKDQTFLHNPEALNFLIFPQWEWFWVCGSFSITPKIPVSEEEIELLESHWVCVRFTVACEKEVSFLDQLFAKVDPYCSLCFNETGFETEVKIWSRNRTVRWYNVNLITDDERWILHCAK